MNIADELSKVRDDVVNRLDAVISWAQSGFSGIAGLGRPHHRRLMVFLDEYQQAFGTVYQVRDRVEEGGLAKRTECKANDADYLAAVRAYLSNRGEAFGAPYMKFAGRMDQWLKLVRGKKGSW